MSNLFPELLDCNLRLEDPPDARTPVVLQPLHLGLYVRLARGAGGVDEVNVALCGGEVALERAELGLEVVV